MARRATFAEAELDALQRAETMTRRLQRLQRLTSALAKVSTPADFGELMRDELPAVFTAGAALLAVPNAEAGALHVLGHDASVPPRPVPEHDPIASAWRSG